MEKLLTANEAADAVRLSAHTLRRKARRGEIPYVSEGRGSPIRFWPRDVLTYARKHTHAVPAIQPRRPSGRNGSVLKAMEDGR